VVTTVSASTQTVWYIDSVNGFDSNPGTIDKPLRTVTKLLQLVAPFGLDLRSTDTWREAFAELDQAKPA